MKRLSAQMQMYIGIGIIAAISIAFVMFAVKPLFEEAKAVDWRVAEESKNLTAAKALVARRQSAKVQSAANEVELMRIANQVPDSPQLPGLIIELQDVANIAGVELPQIQIGTVDPAKPAEDGTPSAHSVLQVTLTIRGSWADVIDFSRRLNSLDRGVRVTGTSYGYVDATEDTKACVQGSATIEVYVMAAAATSTPATAVGVTPASQ